LPTIVSRIIAGGSARNLGVNKNKNFEVVRKKIECASKYLGVFCMAVGSAAVISVRWRLITSLVCFRVHW
jgi:hypothetical protein